MKYDTTICLLIQQYTCLINLQYLQSLNSIYVFLMVSYMNSSINTVRVI